MCMNKTTTIILEQITRHKLLYNSCIIYYKLSTLLLFQKYFDYKTVFYFLNNLFWPTQYLFTAYCDYALYYLYCRTHTHINMLRNKILHIFKL